MEGNEGDISVVFFRIKFLEAPSDCSLGDQFGTRIKLIVAAIVSIDHVHCQSKSTTIYHGDYAVNTLKVEIETIKV